MSSSTQRLRQAAIATAVVSLIIATVLAMTVQPVAAQGTFSSYALTYEGVAAGPAGDVGAGGGLAVIDGGPGAVSGRLDGATAAAEASSVEPGSLARTVTGQANDASGQEIFGEPVTARAEHPGDTSSDDATQAGPQEAGPVTATGGEARARAEPGLSTARAGVTRLEITDQSRMAEALRQGLAAWRARWVDGDGGLAAAQTPRTSQQHAVLIEQASGDGTATADAAGDVLESTVVAQAGRVEILGQVVLEGVVGTARTTATADGLTATSELTVGGATVAGTPVTLDSDGVTVAGETLIPGSDVREANTQLNEVLANAGLEVVVLGSQEQSDGESARARSGGVRVTLITPSSSGIPRNEISLILGRGEATAVAFAADPVAPIGGISVPSSPTAPSGPSGPTTGSGAVSAPPPAAPVGPPANQQPAAEPEVAPPADEPAASAPASTDDVLVAGQRMTKRTAFAGFAAWLLFTFTLPLVGAWVLGRRSA